MEKDISSHFPFALLCAPLGLLHNFGQYPLPALSTVASANNPPFLSLSPSAVVVVCPVRTHSKGERLAAALRLPPNPGDDS